MSPNVLLSDIEKAFLQVSVKEQDRDSFTFLFVINGEEKHLRFTLVPFGVEASPFLLGATLQHHFQIQGPEFGEIVRALKENTYVDNLMQTGGDQSSTFNPQTATLSDKPSYIRDLMQKKSFDKAKQHCEDALKRSGHTTNFTYMTNGTSTPQQSTPSHYRKNRQIKIIWFNPPYSRNVQTNVGKAFLGLITRHFPASHKYHKIFNKNTVKVSYSCMDNMERIIKKHNQKILNANQTTTTHGCNCRKKATCPLENNCLTPTIVYNAKVTTTEYPIGKNYIGLTEGPFKQRYTQHALSFRNRHYANSTELSKFIWHLKDNNTDFQIKCSILASDAAYSNKSERCHLCLAEKFFIIKAEKSTLLKKRSELVSKCRHENKFYLMNLKADHT